MDTDEDAANSELSLHKQLIIENFGSDTSVEDLTKCFSTALNQCSIQTRPQIRLATDRRGKQLGFATVTVPITKVDVFLNYDGWYINKHQLRVSLMESSKARSTWHTTQSGVYTTSKAWVSPASRQKYKPCSLVDGGVFLTNPKIKTPEDVITKAVAAGVEKLVTLGTSVYHSREGLKLSRLFSGTLYCTAGVSPRGAVFWTDETTTQLEEVLQSPQCLAVGPCGFDLSTDQLVTTCDQQLIAFEQQLQLASRLGKPVVVTDNKATTEVISLLTKYKPQLTRVAVMSFPEEPEAFTSYLQQGFYYFISGEIDDNKPPSPLLRCLKSSFEPAWLDQLLLASKCPNRHPQQSSLKRDTGPDLLPGVVESLSKLLGVSEEELGPRMTQHAEEFFWGKGELGGQQNTSSGSEGSNDITSGRADDTPVPPNNTESGDSTLRSRSSNDQRSTDWTYRIVLWLAFITGLLAIYFYDF